MGQLRLRTWRLSVIGRAGNKIGVGGARALATALPQMASLTTLSLIGTSDWVWVAAHGRCARRFEWGSCGCALGC